MRANNKIERRQGVIARFALALWVLGTTSLCFADPDPLELAVHPVMSEEDTLQRYQPLADYLSQKIGRQVVLRTTPSFFPIGTAYVNPIVMI
ncbi:MAG: hypothetical protein OEY67_02500 [Gammaproteobacteria bacterium]|nr:hypothetical protein [Gammaproteobacteria bacterium]